MHMSHEEIFLSRTTDEAAPATDAADRTTAGEEATHA
jgi:hypothetical protein